MLRTNRAAEVLRPPLRSVDADRRTEPAVVRSGVATAPAPRLHEHRAYAAVAAVSLLLSVAGVITFGVPEPLVHDEYSYLFAAETFARFRLANPTPPSPDSFFSPHILVEPSFASKYPPAQGLFLAVGALLGLPVAGVWLSGALAAMALLWCCRAVMSLRWALGATLLFMMSVLVVSRWALSYWGGLVPFLGGALVIGFSLRLRSSLPGSGPAALLGIGLATLALSRPFEGLILCLLLAVVFMDGVLARIRSESGRTLLRRAAVAGTIVGAGLAFQAALNHAVTGSAFRMPHAEFHARHLSVPLFRWQKPAEPLKPDPRLLQVEQSFYRPDNWPAQLGLSIHALRLAVIEVGGLALLILLIPATVVVGWKEPRLLFVPFLVPFVQSAATYVHLSHYYAPAAPFWFLLPAVAGSHLAGRRDMNPLVVLKFALLLGLAAVVPRWLEYRPPLRVRDGVVARYATQPPLIVFVRYDPLLSPHVNVVYNDPDLQNRVLLANLLEDERDCVVVRSFPGRMIATDALPSSGVVETAGELLSRCGEDPVRAVVVADTS